MPAAMLDVPLSATPTSDGRPRRVLLVAYNFPPVGGAGVQRPAKWAKYLRRFGWDVTVLTTENPSVPVRDDSLLADLPDDVTIVRARTLEPDYRVKQGLVTGEHRELKGLLARSKRAVKGVIKRCVKLALQPDPQVLWNPDALRVGRRLMREVPHDAILVTAPAYSSFFIGASLKRQFHVPLILDYRDEWDLSGKYLENAQRDWISRCIQDRMQQRLLRQADAVVATTQMSTLNLADKLASLRHQIPAACIYNGFDSEDFDSVHGECGMPSQESSSTANTHNSTFRLVYTGTLWNLTDIKPLVTAIEQLHASRPDLLKKLELVCVGRKTPEQQQLVDRVRQTFAHVESIDYCEHAQVLRWLRSADGVCLLLSDVPGAERVVPAKLFEYLAIQKDLLAIAPNGETADLVKRFFPSGHLTPDNQSGITQWLENRLADSSGFKMNRNTAAGIQEFSRESQTARLAMLLNDLVAAR